MTAYILGAATLILLVLMAWRRLSPDFRQRSEQPKFQFLSNLGLDSSPEDDRESVNHEGQPNTKEGADENTKP